MRRIGWIACILVFGTGAALLLWQPWTSQGPLPAGPGGPDQPAPLRPPRGLFAPLGAVEEPAPPEPVLNPHPTGEMSRPAYEVDRQVEVIAGKVLDPEGRPVSGARVLLGGAERRTGESGRFILPRSREPLRIIHAEFFPREIDTDDLPFTTLVPGRAPEAQGLEYLDLVIRPGSRIQGRVRNSSGNPVPDARIVFGEMESPPQTFTDRQGVYESPLLPHGVVHVLVIHPDFLPAVKHVSLPAPGMKVRCDLRVEPGEKMVVRVEDPDHEPLSDAEVWIRLEAGKAESTHLPGTPRFGPVESDSGAKKRTPAAEWRFLGRTGDLGTLATCRPPERRASVRVKIAGYRDAIQPVRGPETALTLHPAPHLEGHAVDARTGLPVQLTDLRLEMLSGTEFVEAPDRGRRYRALAQGRFVVGLPPLPGTYRLVAEAEGGRVGRSDPESLSGTASPPPVILELEHRMELRGFVRTPDAVVPDCGVELLQDTRPEGGEWRLLYGVKVPAPFPLDREQQTDPHGVFRFSGLQEGTYRLRVKRPGYAEYLSPPFHVPWEAEYPVLLRKGLKLSGTLYGSEGLPEPDTPVVLTLRRETARVSWTDGDGHFEFRDLLPGHEYHITVGDPRDGPEGLPRPPASGEDETKDTGQVLLTRTITLPEGGNCVYDLRRKASPFGSVHGKLTDGEEPIRGADLRLVSLGPDADPDADRQLSTDADGNFYSRGLSPGTYRLEGLGLPFEEEVVVQAGRRNRVHVDVPSFHHRLTVREEVSGELKEAGASVEWIGPLDSPSGGLSSASRRSSVIDGVAETGGLFPGRYTVRVRVRGLLVHEHSARIEGDTEEQVTVPEVRDVHIRLVSPGGSPFRGLGEVRLLLEGREVYESIDTIHGEVTVPTARPGDYELVVRCEEGVARKAFRVKDRVLANGAVESDNKEVPGTPRR